LKDAGLVNFDQVTKQRGVRGLLIRCLREPGLLMLHRLHLHLLTAIIRGGSRAWLKRLVPVDLLFVVVIIFPLITTSIALTSSPVGCHPPSAMFIF